MISIYIVSLYRGCTSTRQVWKTMIIRLQIICLFGGGQVTSGLVCHKSSDRDGAGLGPESAPTQTPVYPPYHDLPALHLGRAGTR